MSAPPMAANLLVGWWRLVSITALMADGTVNAAIYGAHPTGSITYSTDGHMMVMFARGDRPFLGGDPTSPFDLAAVPQADLAEAFTGFSAYAGTYTVDGSTVYHHLTTASIPNRVGITLARTFSISGHQLTLKTPESGARDGATSFELVWHRQ
ncbi:MAG: hypothetical protein EA368_12715 [Leptolyngbya sp. DLM2.Bin27]|nr:MAG: hypothetical protein EA368_12715 [Leptolyngbya sp. DLM2.Bin27]